MENQNHKQRFCYSSAQQYFGLAGVFLPPDGCRDALCFLVWGFLMHILLGNPIKRFFIFQIQQTPRGCTENETFQWTLKIKYESDLNSSWKRWQPQNICRQRSDESDGLNDSNLIWMKVWRRVRRTYFNKLEQIAKGCSSISITSYLSKKIEFSIHIHTFSFPVNQKLLGWIHHRVKSYDLCYTRR